MDDITYKKRSGTGGVQGQLYETKLLSLVLFRLQRNQHVHKFYLTSNYNNIGEFDDICLRVEMIGCKRPILIFVQAKHKEINNTVLKYDLINNFYNSYLKVKEKFSLKKYPIQEDKIMFQGNFSETECYFILYTNAKYFKESGQHVVYKHSMLNDLLLTADQEAQICAEYDDKDLEILQENILEQEITMLAAQLMKFLNKKSMNVMQATCILRYHVILARHVVHVSEIKYEPNQKLAEHKAFRIMTFRTDFFDTDDNILNKLKKRICEEFQKLYVSRRKAEQKSGLSKELLSIGILTSCTGNDNSSASVNCNSVECTRLNQQISFFLSEPSALTLSPLIDTHIVYENEQLKFLDERPDSDLLKLKQVKVSSCLIDEAKAIAVRNILLSLRLKVPVMFGNVDLIIKGNNQKVEKRLNHLMTAIDNMCEKAKLIGSYKVVTLDETDGSSSVNQYISDAVGNLLIHDVVTKNLMFTTKYDLLQKNAKDLFDRLRNKRYDLHLYRFDIGTVSNIPKLVFDNSEEMKEILKKLLVYEKQSNHEGVGQVLTDEIENYQKISCNYLFKPNKNKLFQCYHSRVLEWWLEEEKQVLTKQCTFHEETVKNMIEEPQMSAMRFVYNRNNNTYFKYDFTHKALETLQGLTNNLTTTIMTDNATLTTIKVIRWLKRNYDDTYSVLDIELMLNLPQEDFKALIEELTVTTKLIIIVCNLRVSGRVLHKRLDMLTIATNSKNKIVITHYEFEKTIKEYFVDANNIKENHNITDLTPALQDELIKSAKVLFQGQELPLYTLVSNYTDIKGTVLNNILRGDIVTIGKPINDTRYAEIIYYIDRRISLNDPKQTPTMRKKHFNVSTFNDIDDDVVLITSAAGMGKSTLLSHMSHDTNKGPEKFWIVRINLLEHTKQLKKWQIDNILINHLTMLNFMCRVTLTNYKHEIILQIIDSIVTLKTDGTNEEALFELNIFLRFYNERKVILVFDGFDEIYPDYKDQAIDMFKLIKDDSRKLKMWITSRPYTEILLDLESVTDKSYALAYINGPEMMTYLKTFWHQYIPVESISDEQRNTIISTLQLIQFSHEDNLNLAPVYNCLETYLKSTSDDKSCQFWYNNDLLGTPLLLYLLADHIAYSVNNFDPNKFKCNTNIIKMYKTFMEKNLTIFYEIKYNEDLSKPYSKRKYARVLDEYFTKYKKMAAYAIFKNNMFRQHCLLEEFKDMPFNCENRIKIRAMIENFKGNEEPTDVISYVTSDNVPVFVHKTFAEYLAAEFMCDILKSDIDGNKKRLIYGAICFYTFGIYYTWIRAKRQIDAELDQVLTEVLDSNPVIVDIFGLRKFIYVPGRWTLTDEQFIRLYSSRLNDYKPDLNTTLKYYLSFIDTDDEDVLYHDNRLNQLEDIITARMEYPLRKYFPNAPIYRPIRRRLNIFTPIAYPNDEIVDE